MGEEKKRLAGLARGVQGLRRQSRDLRAEVDFLDRFSTSLPAAACAAARSYLAMIEHAAEMTLAQVQVLRAEIAKQQADLQVKRLSQRLR
ncbi:MAG TPA: hypothetical protein VHO67_19375 [Polyangia bacterium]|nr:hypothetical protein [Polyangia bacterium]